MLPYDYGPAAPRDATRALRSRRRPGSSPIRTSRSAGPAGGHPEASYEQREGSARFVAALQHLGANQRAVLILREVMGFTAQEAATMLETTVASVNSALSGPAPRSGGGSPRGRSRRRCGTRRPWLHDWWTLRQAWERCDVDAFTALLVRTRVRDASAVHLVHPA